MVPNVCLPSHSTLKITITESQTVNVYIIAKCWKTKCITTTKKLRTLPNRTGNPHSLRSLTVGAHAAPISTDHPIFTICACLHTDTRRHMHCHFSDFTFCFSRWSRVLLQHTVSYRFVVNERTFLSFSGIFFCV